MVLKCQLINEMYCLKKEYFENEKIFIGIETKQNDIFGFILIKENNEMKETNENEQYKKIYFVSLNNAKKLGIQIHEKINTELFIKYDENQPGYIEFESIMKINNEEIERDNKFNKQFKNGQLDLDFYVDFGKSPHR